MSTSFQEILGKISIEEFKEKYWGKKTLHIKNAVHHPELFCSKETFEELLEQDHTRLKFRPNMELDKSLIKDPNDPHAAMVYLDDITPKDAKKLRDTGWYLNVENAEVGNLALSSFITSIENHLDSITNQYLVDYFQGSKGKGGLKWHNDYSDVFSIQLEGNKVWYVDEKPSDLKLSFIGLPLFPDKLWISSHARRDEVVDFKDNVHNIQTINMQKGDFLYMPSFTMHCTKPESEYTLSVSILREWMSIPQIIDKLIEFNDPNFHLALRNALSIPDSVNDIRENFLNHLKSVRQYLSKQNQNYFKKMGWYSSLPNFNPEKSEFNFAPQPMPMPRNFNKTLLFQRDPTRRVKVLNYIEDGIKKRELYIDGQAIEFDNEQWFTFVDFLANDKPFSASDILNASNLHEPKHWRELKSHLVTLLDLGYIGLYDKWKAMDRNPKIAG